MFNFTENLTCIDESWSRLSRLKDISKWYVGETPSSMLVSKRDGRLLEDPFYNKVHLVVTHLITMKIVNMHLTYSVFFCRYIHYRFFPLTV